MDRSHFENREPQEGPDDVEEREERDKGLPHWADWAPSKAKLALTLGPIIAIPLILNPVLWIGRVWMIAHAPLLLMGLSNKAVYLALAVTQVNIVAYFVVAIVRRIIFAPCYFFLGRWGSERGLAWMAQNSPSSARILERLTRWFPKFGPLLVMFYPAPIVRVLAGASPMRFFVFMVYEAIGATSIATAIFLLSREFPEQLKTVIDFIKDHTWQLTIVSLVYVAIIVAVGERKNSAGSRKKSLEKLEETMEENIERNPRS